MLRRARKLAGFTQEEMAEKMNVSRPNISKLERDQIELKASDLIKWFHTTNMSEVAAAVICGVDPMVLMDVMTNITHLIGGFILWS